MDEIDTVVLSKRLVFDVRHEPGTGAIVAVAPSGTEKWTTVTPFRYATTQGKGQVTSLFALPTDNDEEKVVVMATAFLNTSDNPHDPRWKDFVGEGGSVAEAIQNLRLPEQLT